MRQSSLSSPCEEVADHLGTIHHEIYFTPEEALDALPDIIWHLETFEQVRSDCLLIVYACTRTHSQHPPSWPLVPFPARPDCLRTV